MMLIMLPAFLLIFAGCFSLFGIKNSLAYDQIINTGIALVAYFIIRKIGYRFFRANYKFFYWFFIILLLITFIIGFEVKGSLRWIDLYFFNLQPSELFKVFYIVFLAEYFSRLKKSANSWKDLIISFLYATLPIIIIFKQPDLGNAVVYFAIYFVLLFFSEIPKKVVISLLAGIIFFVPISWLFLHDYQRNRLLSFISPGLDQQGNSYNMIQAIITIGSGQFIGKGLGLGTQSRLFFLPENHTDFAVASLIEQFGFISGVMLLIFFILIITQLMKRTLKLYKHQPSSSLYGFYYCLGLLVMLSFQIILNFGMNLGILPITGITLPFISYGGSALVTLLCGLALLPK